MKLTSKNLTNREKLTDYPSVFIFRRGGLMKKFVVGSVALAMFAIGSSAVMADSTAVVAQATGKVMVDSGKGFVPVKAGFALKDGDRVVALKASSARINFAQGCALTLAENNLVSVSKEAGCKTEIVAVNRAADPSAVAAVGGAAAGGAAAAGGGGAAAGAGAAAAGLGGLGTIAGVSTVVVVGGVVAAGAVVADSTKNDDTPISVQ